MSNGSKSLKLKLPSLGLIVISMTLIVTTIFFHSVNFKESSHEDKNNNEVLNFVKFMEHEVTKLEKLINATTTAKVLISKLQAEDTKKPLQSLNMSSSNNLGLTDTVEDMNSVERSEKLWFDKMKQNFLCIRNHNGCLYLYHTRKAAGTTLREILQPEALRLSIPLYETEGLSLKKDILSVSGMFSVTTLRDPVKRVLSLYWYEHVGWYDGILHETHKCKRLKDWVQAWSDGHPWKNSFMLKNPSNVYVEIENYYVKMLSDWKGPDKVTRLDLEKAKTVLSAFDLVVIVEWIGDESQIEAINSIFPGRSNIAAEHKVRGDKASIERLQDKLAPDRIEITKKIEDMNALDIELYEFAKSMVAKRLKLIPSLVKKSTTASSNDSKLLKACQAHARLPSSLKSSIGIFRPPGHKGPL